MDNLWEKCTWEFEFIVPKYLEEDADAMDVDGEEGGGDTGLHPVVVVCSGELVEKVRINCWSSRRCGLTMGIDRTSE